VLVKGGAMHHGRRAVGVLIAGSAGSDGAARLCEVK
jgi:hypothetical protein